MKIYNLIPILTMGANFLSAVGCAYFGKYGSAIYSASAGMLNLAVIFLIPGMHIIETVIYALLVVVTLITLAMVTSTVGHILWIFWKG